MSAGGATGFDQFSNIRGDVNEVPRLSRRVPPPVLGVSEIARGGVLRAGRGLRRAACSVFLSVCCRSGATTSTACSLQRARRMREVESLSVLARAGVSVRRGNAGYLLRSLLHLCHRLALHRIYHLGSHHYFLFRGYNHHAMRSNLRHLALLPARRSNSAAGEPISSLKKKNRSPGSSDLIH
jgi:hypothetical protein